MSYIAPTEEIAFYLSNCTSALALVGAFPDLDQPSLRAILEEAGKLTRDVLLPMDVALDREGAAWTNSGVKTASGHKKAYAAFVDGGWMGVALPIEWGGQDLPQSLNAACLELWHSGSMAFSMGTILTMGAAETIHAFGSEELKQAYLPKLVKGDWAATMAMTEPQAGSDLGEIRTRATPHGDGSYRLAGTKIFISYGEHDLTDNIVHLVLAKLPDAPKGAHGISLFLVPKMLAGTGGSLRNDVRCIGIEKKLGQHGSPTCIMAFGENNGAIGWLVGEPHKGLSAMFTMMNRARLAIAVQGVAIAERAFQKSLRYSIERRQGRGPGGAVGPVAIASHPDVQRMLATMSALTSAARAIALSAADAIDRSRHAALGEERAEALLEADLLTPVAKAFCSDIGCDVASLAIQIHGGCGYVEETGVAGLWRDARIAPIYEGTNGIQAIDLVGRKLAAHGGAAMYRLAAGFAADARKLSQSSCELTSQAGFKLLAACDRLKNATGFILQEQHGRSDEVLGCATEFLRLVGLTMGCALLGRALLKAEDQHRLHRYYRSSFLFFVDRLLPEVRALEEIIIYGAPGLQQVGLLLAEMATDGPNGAYAARLQTEA
jgi:3-(methylsulfanyl)propanoyl-CoA dehydrogenase